MGLTLQDMIRDGLVDELANVFTREVDADIVLAAIAFPRAHKPQFQTSIQFWMDICQAIDNGIIAGGSLETLLAIASSRLPANPKFAPFGQSQPPAVQAVSSQATSSSPAPHPSVPSTPTSSQVQQSSSTDFQALQVFLCHSSGDKPAVRELYQKLKADGFKPWLDEVDILPSKLWDPEIRKGVRTSDVVVVCLSKVSISKIGYVQKEIKMVLDEADKQPEGSIFLIPLKLEDCEIPDRLSSWQGLDYFRDMDAGYQRLRLALKQRADDLR